MPIPYILVFSGRKDTILYASYVERIEIYLNDLLQVSDERSHERHREVFHLDRNLEEMEKKTYAAFHDRSMRETTFPPSYQRCYQDTMKPHGHVK